MMVSAHSRSKVVSDISADGSGSCSSGELSVGGESRDRVTVLPPRLMHFSALF